MKEGWLGESGERGIGRGTQQEASQQPEQQQQPEQKQERPTETSFARLMLQGLCGYMGAFLSASRQSLRQRNHRPGVVSQTLSRTLCPSYLPLMM